MPNAKTHEETMTCPLISVLVLCYNNLQYIYENLQSIFSQTYPNIEILIADDASTKFDALALINWINKNRTSNITQISIYENPYNMGTVASLENLHQKSKGAYLFNIAADDVLFDTTVLQSLYDKTIENRADMVLAQTEFWNESLTGKISDFISEENIKKIKEGTAEQLFAEICQHPIFPACYLYHRSVLEKIGPISKKYDLIEDWPVSLIVTRNGDIPAYLDHPSAIKHRDGGISHGNSRQTQRALLRYYRDFYEIYTHEIEPYLQLLNEDTKANVIKKAQDRLRAYYKIHIPHAAEVTQQTTSVKPAQINVQPLPNSLRDHIKRLAYFISSKSMILLTFILMILSEMGTLTCLHFEKNLSFRILLTLTGLLTFSVAAEILIYSCLQYRNRC